jgi:type II secretory pathway component PulF
MTVGQALDRVKELLPSGPGTSPAGSTPLCAALAPLLAADPEAQAEGVALAAAEPVGELTRTLRQLAEDLEATMLAWREALMAMAYPLLVLHLVAPAANLSLLLVEPARFAWVLVLSTGLIWAILGLALGAWRWLARSPVSALRLARIPLVGAPLVLAARARWLRLVATLHGAGTKAIEGFALAERALGPAAPSTEYAAVTARARRGGSFEEALRELTGLPAEELTPLLASAAVGEFESAARRLADATPTRWRESGRRLARAAGGTVYAATVVVVVVTLIRFYADYYGALLGGR